MSIFTTSKELQAKIQELTESNDAYQEKVESLINEKIELEQKVSLFETEKAELSAKLADALADKETIQTEANEAIETAKKVIDGQPKAVADEAARQVAAIGHEPVASTEADEEVVNTSLSIAQQYQKMTAGKERDAFYKENKAEIFKALKN